MPPDVAASVAAASVVPPVRSGDRLLISLKGEEGLADLLRRILLAGGRVHSVIPQRRSLEEVFFERIREGTR
jgi:hypothetical protein